MFELKIWSDMAYSEIDKMCWINESETYFVWHKLTKYNDKVDNIIRI